MQAGSSSQGRDRSVCSQDDAMNGHDPVAAGLLILALAPVELDALQVAISLVGIVLMGAAWVTWNAARKSSPTTEARVS